MELIDLSNEELTGKLLRLRGIERETTLSIMEYLNEVDRRKLYLELGYSSLFDFCTRKLLYSEGSAYRRIQGARCIKENPELKNLFLAGKVTLCTIALASKSIATKDTKVEEIIGKSKREVELLVAKSVPSPKKEIIKPIVVKTNNISPPKEERFEIRFSVSKEVYLEFEEAKNKLSNSLKASLTVENVFKKLLELYLKPKRRESLKSSDTRYVPRGVKDEVFKRDKAQCSFISKDGTRCTERKFLHLDHVMPFSIGGKTEASNLRLLCASHNRLLAKESFGEKKLSEFNRHR